MMQLSSTSEGFPPDKSLQRVLFLNLKTDTDVQNRLLDSLGEGEGQMF